jgi:hypothetical protein
MSARLRPAVVAIAAVTWIIGIAAGFLALRTYSATPGPSGVVATRWPAAALPRPDGRPTILMVVHPECPCSRASIGELGRVMARTRRKAAAEVLVAVPPELADRPESDLIRSARAIPGVRVTVDRGARATAAFGALVSGHTLLYDAAGALVFEGGITASRGHAGDNANEDALVAAIETGRPTRRRAPVFGCLLTGTSS